MRDALRVQGKDHVFLGLPNGDHYLSLESNRTRFFQELESFLEANIRGENKKKPEVATEDDA
jgi:dipeptidyl aminopeptidase/acylaminoacyl peptidase